MSAVFSCFEHVFLRFIVDNLLQEENTMSASEVMHRSSFVYLCSRGLYMTQQAGKIVDVGDEFDAGFGSDLDDFFTEIGEVSPIALHGNGEEQSMHGGIMQAMDHPPQPEMPLTSVINQDNWYRR